MNCISLHQPWASAIAVGLKSIETRSWPAPASVIGRPLAIAAAKKNTPELRRWWEDHVIVNPAFLSAFSRTGINYWSDLPFGCVVATTKCVTSISTNIAPPSDLRQPLDTDEYWGDFGEDRHLWFLDKIVALPEPRIVIGRQGIFNVEL